MQACKLVPSSHRSSSFGKVASCKEGRDPDFGNVGFTRLKPSGYFTYRQFNIQQTVRSAHAVCLCDLCGSENKQQMKRAGWSININSKRKVG